MTDLVDGAAVPTPRDPDPADRSPHDARRAVRNALAVLAGLALLVVLRPSLLGMLAIVVGLLITVMLHEFGHYVVAKRCGMKVTEYFLGFGPRIWSFHRGETEYGVKAIPAGGYVRIIGMNNVEEVDPADEPRTYRAASFPKRLATVLAGITVNFLVFLLLIFVILVGRGQEVGLAPIVGEVLPDTPAAAAGLQTGDEVVAVGGLPVDDFDEVRDQVRPAAGEELHLTVLRGGERLTIPVVPEAADGEGRLGVIAGDDIIVERYSVPSAAKESVVWLGRGTVETVEALGRVFSPSGARDIAEDVTSSGGAGAGSGSGAGEPIDDRPRSVIGITYEGSRLVDGDLWMLLALLASINLFLALFNLVPLLPFDGGHAAVAIYEAAASRLQGRRVVVDYRKLVPVTVVVMAVLLTFGVSIMYLDIRDIVAG